MKTYLKNQPNSNVCILSSNDLTFDLFSNAKSILNSYISACFYFVLKGKYLTNILVLYLLKSVVPMQFCKQIFNLKGKRQTYK